MRTWDSSEKVRKRKKKNIIKVNYKIDQTWKLNLNK